MIGNIGVLLDDDARACTLWSVFYVLGTILILQDINVPDNWHWTNTDNFWVLL